MAVRRSTAGAGWIGRCGCNQLQSEALALADAGRESFARIIFFAPGRRFSLQRYPPGRVANRWDISGL